MLRCEVMSESCGHEVRPSGTLFTADRRGVRGLRLRTAEDVFGDEVLGCDSALDAWGTQIIGDGGVVWEELELVEMLPEVA